MLLNQNATQDYQVLSSWLEMVHCTIIQIKAQQEQRLEVLELSNYRGCLGCLQMLRAEWLSNSFVSTETFLKETLYIYVMCGLSP